MQNNSIPLYFSKLSNKRVNVEITKAEASNHFSSCYDTLQSNGYRVVFSPYTHVISKDKCITKHTDRKHRVTRSQNSQFSINL